MPLIDAYLTAFSDAYATAPRSDIYEASYADAYGAPFGSAPLDVKVELDLNGTWTDTTGDVYQRDGTDAITIARGRADETSQANPGSMAWEWNNRQGTYSPRNPLGAYYGLLGRNTPVRCSVPALEPFLRCENDAVSGASCPDAPSLGISQALDVRIDLSLSSYLPSVLASKWTATTGSVALGGTIVGATCNQACYPGSGSQIAAGQHMDSLIGRPLAETSQKVFFETGSTTTFPSSVLSKDKGLLDAKVLLWLCYKPLPDGSQLGVLSTSINAYLAYALAAGAPQPKIILWQEPQNSSNVALGLPNAASYKTCMVNHYSAIKALAGSPAVVYCSASHLGETGVASWYPGDAYCDEVGQDLYGYTWKHGTTLTTLASIADAASPQKPLSHLEAGTALSQSQADTMSHTDVANYFAYSTGVFTARSAAGLPNGSWMWFNGLGGANWNTIQPGDFRVGKMQTLYDALQPSTSGGTSAGRSWALTLNGDGTLSFRWTSDGTLGTVTTVTSTAPIPLGPVTLRVKIQKTSGVVQAQFFTAPAGNSGGEGPTLPWTQLGSTVLPGGDLAIVTAAAPLQIGYNSEVAADYTAYGGLTGKVSGFQLRSFAGSYQDSYFDIYGTSAAGTVVADAALTSQQPGAEEWEDAQGNQWSLTDPSEISARSYRFHGEMSSLPTQWDPTGTDVYAPVQAGGLLRRMSQGQQPPVSSAFKRAVLGVSGIFTPLAYWPGEDAAGATQLGPAIGTAAMVFDSAAPSLASDSGFDCSLPLPTLAFNSMTGSVQPYTGGTAAIVRFLMHVPASNTIADDSVICRVNTTGAIGDLSLRWKTGGDLRLSGYGGGAFVFDTGPTGNYAVNGELALVSMELTTSGGSLKWALRVLAAGSDSPVVTTGTASGTPGNVTAVHLGGSTTTLEGTGIGHVFVQAAFEGVTDFADALAAHAGETAANRFARLCTENAISPRIYGAPDTDVPMGAQQPDTLNNLLQLCETTGRGQIYEPRQSLTLGYRTVRSLCQQTPAFTADYAQAHLGDGTQGLVPVTDDQHTVNDVTVSSQAGGNYETTLDDGSAMSVSQPPAGVGPYGNSYTINTATDSQLPDVAGWLLNTGTVAAERYPVIPFHLARPAAAPVFYKVQETGIGDLAQVVNTPSFLPPGPVNQLVYGTTEVLGGWQYRVAFNCVPEQPYEVGIFADPVFGRMNTDGSALDTDIGAADTSFGADTTGPSGITWTTSAADFPFDIICGGEQMTVTAIAAPSANFLVSDDTGFETSAGNWTAGSGCTVARSTAVRHSGSGSLAMTSDGSGTMNAVSSAAGTILTLGMAVNPGDKISVSAWFKAATNGRYCVATVDFYDSGGAFLLTPNGAQVIDSTTAWTQAASTLTAPASAAWAAADLQAATTALDSGQIHYVDDVFLANLTAAGSPLQVFTVTRSVNGVVKAHTAGEAVTLAHPAIIGLA
jgi:hypothetical protein